ncbi:MAG: guanylate kinase [Faecousia sp.]
MSQGKLIVISGASGVGKGTVLELMMEKRPELSFSVSATTRPPRPGEVEGQHYFFVTRERFRRMIAEDAFLEYDEHNECYYGTPRAQVAAKREKGHVLLDIEPKGAKMVKAAVPDAVLIFIMPPSMEELERRLRGRGDTPEDQIVMRLKRAKWEMEQRFWYDHVVVNDIADRCAREILSIIGE